MFSRKSKKCTKRRALVAATLAAIYLLIFRNKKLNATHHRPTLYTCMSNPIDWTAVDADDAMTSQQIMDYLHWSNSSSCRLVQYFGGVAHHLGVDGQKAVCMDPQVRPQYEDCVVYSFGINNSEWSFEDTMYVYGCKVFVFDPSNDNYTTDYALVKENVHYFKLGLGETSRVNDEGLRLHTLSTLYDYVVKKNHHAPDSVIDYLKIDVDGEEWTILPQILQSGILDRVKQLGLEIHLPEHGDIGNIRTLVKLLRTMESQHAMVRFDSKPNPYSEHHIKALDNLYGFTAFELAWYNNKLRKHHLTTFKNVPNADV